MDGIKSHKVRAKELQTGWKNRDLNNADRTGNVIYYGAVTQ